MRIPSIDERDKKELIRHIKSVSAAYTPEWRFDEENPDVGTALAMIYADMFEGSIKRFNRIPEKNMLAFYNEINARCLPAIPAFGYVNFGLAGEIEGGQEVPRNTQLIADTPDDEEGTTIFETVNDVYVVASEPTQIFCTSGKYDYISLAYDREAAVAGQDAGDFSFFDLRGENIQEHVLYFCQQQALNIKNGAWIEIRMNPHFQHKLSQDVLDSILSESNAVWEYLTEQGWTSFSGQRVQGEKLLFFKSERQPAFCMTELFETESFWIRCRVKNIDKLDKLNLDRVEIASMGAGIEPECVNAAGTDQNIHEFFPFGEKPNIYDDVYIAAEDALCKTGAKIKVTFNLNFAQVPIDLDITDPSINWKLIMRRSNFKLDKEYDITIGEVIWEYFNGKGWAKLFAGDDYKDAFSVDRGTTGQYITLEFRCPQDMEKILINSCESCYIRARIVKLNNAFKFKGNYISPVIDGMSFSYSYDECGLLPELIATENNIEIKTYEKRAIGDESFFFTPFYRIAEEAAVMYIGFDRAPVGGPIKMLYSLRESISDKVGRLAWEYYGKGGWTLLNVADETENLRKTGIVTFIGPKDITQLKLWGKEQYWIRVADTTERYNDLKKPAQLPRIRKIYMNATQIINTASENEEYFFIEPQQENMACHLLNQKIQQVQVQVLEEGIWTEWSEVTDFLMSEPESRHFCVDRNEGVVYFSNGREGRIPQSGDEDTIKICYSTGGGSLGNLPEGSVNKSNLAIGFVNDISNPGVTFGGCDTEETQAAAARTAAAIKHGYRGVTARDYEALSLEATRNVLKAKCFAGYNDRGEKEPGCVTLVLLQKSFEKGRDFFGAIRQQVSEYISERTCGILVDLEKFKVVEPQFLEMCIKVELTVSNYNQIFSAKEQINQRLEIFLNPMTGNFDGRGWEIGTLPNSTQVLNSIKDISEIKYIKSVFVSAYTEGRFGRVEADLDSMRQRILALPLSGNHEIIITVDEGR